MSPWFLALAFLLVLINGVFVALEFALVGTRRDRLEALAADGSRRARSAMSASRDLTMELAGAQLGITMASLGIGAVGEPAMAEIFEHLLGPVLPEGAVRPVGVALGLAVVVFLHMVLGEVVPKNLALAGPERSLLWLAPLSRAYLKVFRPVVRVLQSAGNAGVRLFRVEPRDELESVHTPEELAVMLAESHEGGYIEEFAHDLLAGVLDFSDRAVASIMAPRDQIVWVPRDATVAEVEQVVVRSGHSRLPVTEAGDLDNVLGFVHAKDLLNIAPDEYERPLPLRLVRRMLVAPRDRTCEDLLLSMRRARVHFALVIDPNLTTAGLVTLEDLLEELVGDILDESDVR